MSEVARAAPSRFALWAFGGWAAASALWWALAFAPLPVPQLELARLRAVCFGALDSGLPDARGWTLLVLGPASMLGFLLAVWGLELLASLRWLARRPAGIAVLVAFVATSAAGLVGVGSRVAAGLEVERAAGGAMGPMGPMGPMGKTSLPADYPRGHAAAPPLDLVDQQGARMDLAALRGRPAIVTFAYAHCATVCPTLVDTVRRAALAAADPERPPVVLIVTLDPWRDTPGALPGLATAWRLVDVPDAHLLSGSVEEVQAVLAGWNVASERDERTGEIGHPALVYVVDAEGRLAYSFLSPPVQWIVDGLDRLGSTLFARTTVRQFRRLP